MTPALPATDYQPAAEGVGLWRDSWRRFRTHRAAVVSGVIVLAIVIASLVGPWLVSLYNGFEYDTLVSCP
jgi:ABC-type antimicrobial peptide transport system permease subunit